ncbi:hypothetical protein IWW55_003576, partial [Coemansia sp. RSA 2706]
MDTPHHSRTPTQQELSAALQQQGQDVGRAVTPMPLLTDAGTAGLDVFQHYALHVPFASDSYVSGDLTNWAKVTPQSQTPGAPEPSFPRVPTETASTAHRRRGTVPQEGTPRPRQFFSRVQEERAVYSTDQVKHTVRMYPQVDRGFFMSDSDWTCYRRNYFQVSCAFALSPTSPGPFMVADREGMRAVRHFLIGISARVAANSARVELVQHTPKRDKGPQITPQPQPVRPNEMPDPSASVAASFERLQFKTATANNGKRRAAQQYYVLELALYADCADGTRVLVATTESPPIVVRGRSPGHYADSRRTVSDTTTRMAASLSASSVQHRGSPPARPHAPPPNARSQSSDMLDTGENSSAAAVAAALAAAADPTTFSISPDDMVQALSAMVPSAMVPSAVPPPHEILARAQNISADALGLPEMKQKPAPAIVDAISSGMTLSMAASIAGSMDTGSQFPGLDIRPSSASQLDSADSLSLLQ